LTVTTTLQQCVLELMKTARIDDTEFPSGLGVWIAYG
jgi:hypothetical protein